MSPDDPVPEDPTCAYCEKLLPADPDGAYRGWSFEGFCGPLCGLRCGIDLLTTAARRTPSLDAVRKNIARAMADLFPDGRAEGRGVPR